MLNQHINGKKKKAPQDIPRLVCLGVATQFRRSYAALNASSSKREETVHAVLWLTEEGKGKKKNQWVTENGKMTETGERKHRFRLSVSKKKCFTYFMFCRSCCFVSSCLADCGSGLLIAVIDMQESGSGCQKPQQKKKKSRGPSQSVPVGRSKHK